MGSVSSDPSNEPASAEPAAPGPAVEYCYRHPGVQTGVHCTRCGRPICTNCMIPAPVGYQCPECVGRARREFRAGPKRRARRFASISATSLVLGAILVMFVLELVVSGGGLQLNNEVALIELGALFPPAVAAGQYWRLLSAMFLHAGLLHLALNAYALYLFGRFVEETFGKGRFVAIYVVSGFLASVASYAFGPVGAIGVGASGAISGLLGAFIAYNFRRRHLSLAAGNLRLALMIIVINALFGLTVPGIDNRAHLGGLVAGIAAGVFAEGMGPRGARRWTQVAGFVALISLGIAIVAWRTVALREAFPQLGS
jgi:membrane associated rhomboid family serine protease